MVKTAIEGKTQTDSVTRGNDAMKFRVPQAEFAASLDRVLQAVPQKTTMPVLGHLLLEAERETVRLTATDLDLTISTAVRATVEREGKITLPAKRFAEIVRQLDPSSDVEIDIQRGNALIVGGRANFRIVGMNAEEFPRIPDMAFKKGLSLPEEILKKAIQRSVFCVSRDETRRALTGVLWEVTGSSLAMVGTDGHRLARISLPVSIDVEGRREVIVPTKTLQQLLRLVGETAEGAVALKLGDDHAVFRIGETTLFTRLIEGPYPKYQDVIPKNNDKRLVVKRAALLDALRRVNLLSDTITHQVRFSLSPDRLVLSARMQDVGEAREELEVQYNAEEMDLGYNAVYLGDVLRAMETEEILVSLSTPLNAGLFEPTEQGPEENFLCLVMPLRLVD
jgi:DNA polymerase-3 subunit beta